MNRVEHLMKLIDINQNRESLSCLWKRAAAMDETLYLPANRLKKLAGREITTESWSRTKLFRAIANQRVVLFHDFPLRSSMAAYFSSISESAARIKSLFSRRSITLTKCGPGQKRRWQNIHRVVDVWERNRATLSANDIFYRDLKLDKTFDCEAIGDFSVLRYAREDIRDLEVATMLLGTSGCMSDSHSDDPDGCNHCIFGKKLWLIWDRQEGARHGLQDCEYDDVYTQSDFDMHSFLKLRSGWWFTVSAGRTVFLPGNYTHKVITLDRYLGISNFYVGLPNALSSLTRWKLDGATMVTADLWEEIATLVLKQLKRCSNGDQTSRRRWGFYHLRESLEYWQQHRSRKQQVQLLRRPVFRHIVERIKQV